MFEENNPTYKFYDWDVKTDVPVLVNPTKEQIDNPLKYRKFAFFPDPDTLIMWPIQNHYDGLPAHYSAIVAYRDNVVKEIGRDNTGSCIMGQIYYRNGKWNTEYYSDGYSTKFIRKLSRTLKSLGVPSLKSDCELWNY